MGGIESEESHVKFRCFGNLYSDEAKECSVCKTNSLCKSCSVSGKQNHHSEIRQEIFKFLQDQPRTIDEIIDVVSKTSRRQCKGTTVFYHLSLMKKDGQLHIVEHNGKKCYVVFSSKGHSNEK